MMIANIAAALRSDPVKSARKNVDNARAAFAAATAEREKRAAAKVEADRAFHDSGRDADAERATRAALHLQRAERLEQEARDAFTAAEQAADLATRDAAAVGALSAEGAALDAYEQAARAADTALRAAASAAEKARAALEAVDAALQNIPAKRAELAASLVRLREVSPTRADELAAAGLARLEPVADRAGVHKRADVTLRAFAELRRTASACESRVRAMVGDQAAAARAVGAQPMPEGFAVAMMERALDASPDFDALDVSKAHRWMTLAFSNEARAAAVGEPLRFNARPSWSHEPTPVPHAAPVTLDAAGRVLALRTALRLLWTMPEAEAAPAFDDIMRAYVEHRAEEMRAAVEASGVHPVRVSIGNGRTMIVRSDDPVHFPRLVSRRGRAEADEEHVDTAGDAVFADRVA